MVLLRQYRSNLPCNIYLDDCGTYDKPTVFIQLTLHRTPLSDSSVITDCIQMTLDGDVDEEVHEHPENRLRVEILAKVSSFVKQNRAYIYSLWDCNDDYDIKDFINDMKPYNSSISDNLIVHRENCDEKNEPDKTKTKVSRLNDPDANPLWLSISTYDDPKHHVIRRIFVHKINAHKPCILRDTEKRKDYKPIKNEVYELDFHLGDLKFICEDDMTPPTEE